MPVREEVKYRPPTERFSDYHTKEIILATLKEKGMSLEHRNFFEHIVPHEELGFFGYHSSTQGFRIYQDIIRMVLEEVMDIPVKEDFHFLRSPVGSTLRHESADAFIASVSVVDDHVEAQKQHLLSMNYTLYGNFDKFGECSIYWFTANKSASTVGFQKELEKLFLPLGIPLEAIEELFKIGEPLMEEGNAVLFQFFDFSHHNGFENYYALVDRMCYISLPLGRPFRVIKPSVLYLGTGAQPFSLQFRLVINNEVVLNPYSALHIRRYERSDLAIVREYEKRLREAIRALHYDKAAIEKERALLMKAWRQSDEV